MAAKRSGRRRHVPRRTCVGCREVLPKRALIRLVRTEAGGVMIDPTSKSPGRGAYLHDQRSCWESALRGPLAAALRIELTQDSYRDLVAFMDQINERPAG